MKHWLVESILLLFKLGKGPLVTCPIRSPSNNLPEWFNRAKKVRITAKPFSSRVRGHSFFLSFPPQISQLRSRGVYETNVKIACSTATCKQSVLTDTRCELSLEPLEVSDQLYYSSRGIVSSNALEIEI